MPDDEEYHDWIAVHVVDFFNRVNIIYGTVCEYCTEATCPTMSGGPKFEYYWADEVQKKPQALPAPQVINGGGKEGAPSLLILLSQYVAKLMVWIEKQINDVDLFPVEVGESCVRVGHGIT